MINEKENFIISIIIWIITFVWFIYLYICLIDWNIIAIVIYFILSLWFSIFIINLSIEDDSLTKKK